MTNRSFQRKTTASVGRMLASEMSSGNGIWAGPFHTSPTFCRINDMPMAVIRTASRGELRKGLYATRSIPTLSSPQAIIATAMAISTPPP